MKKHVAILMFFAVSIPLFTLPALAQAATDLELTRTAIEANRKLIVANNLDLTEEEATKFWPVFNESQVAMRKITDRKIALIKAYANEYKTLTDERALELLSELMDIKAKHLKLRKSYVKKFKKILPGKKVVRYFQVESKLDAIVDYDLAANIPLVQ